MLEDRGRRGARAEMVDPDDRTLVADVALPAERDAGLDAQPLASGDRQDRVAIADRLDLEQLPAGEGHDPRPDALGRQQVGCRRG